MHYMVMFILDDLEKGSAVLDAWEATGTRGITIFESTGIGRMRRLQNQPREIPLMPTLRTLLQSHEDRHRTIMSVVEGEEMVDKLIEVTESVMGDLDEPNKGVIFVLPVTKVVGMGNMTSNE